MSKRVSWGFDLVNRGAAEDSEGEKSRRTPNSNRRHEIGQKDEVFSGGRTCADPPRSEYDYKNEICYLSG